MLILSSGRSRRYPGFKSYALDNFDFVIHTLNYDRADRIYCAGYNAVYLARESFSKLDDRRKTAAHDHAHPFIPAAPSFNF